MCESLLIASIIVLLFCCIRREYFDDLGIVGDKHNPYVYSPGDFKHIARTTEERQTTAIDESVIPAFADPMYIPKENNSETWATIVSPDCMKILREGNMHSGSFGELVDCLQHNYEKVSVNNLNV